MKKIIDRTVITLVVTDTDGVKTVKEVSVPRREVRMDRHGYFRWAEQHLPQRIEERYTVRSGYPEFRPSELVLVYAEREDFNGEKEFTLSSATIAGFNLLKSGRTGKKTLSNVYYRNATDMPAWMAHAVAAFDPNGTDNPFQA